MCPDGYYAMCSKQALHWDRTLGPYSIIDSLSNDKSDICTQKLENIPQQHDPIHKVIHNDQ